MKYLLPLPCAALLTIALLGGSGDAHAKDSLQPHEASYEVKMKEWKFGATPASITASALIRYGETCQAWDTKFALKLSARIPERGDFNLELRSEVEELRDGTAIGFKHVVSLNDRTASEIVGSATRRIAGARGAISFLRPKPETSTLPAGTLFPTESFFTNIAEIRRGKKIFSFSLFDGSSKNPVQLFQTLTRQKKLAGPPPTGDVKLLDTDSWRLAGSFSDDAKADSAAEASFITVVHDNGIISFLQIDTGFAVVDLELRRIRALPKPSC